MVLRGKFQIFKDDNQTPDAKSISYDFDIIRTDGEIFRVVGNWLPFRQWLCATWQLPRQMAERLRAVGRTWQNWAR
jgi:hypothetical protein